MIVSHGRNLNLAVNLFLIDLDINVLQKIVVYSCDNFISAILAVDCHLIFESLRSYFHDFKGLLLITIFKYKNNFPIWCIYNYFLLSM